MKCQKYKHKHFWLANMIENTHDKHMTGLTFFSDVQQEHFEGQNDVEFAGTRDE